MRKLKNARKLKNVPEDLLNAAYSEAGRFPSNGDVL